jgi:hypothetical protein
MGDEYRPSVSVPCRPGTPRTNFKSRQGAMCPAAPDPASLPRWGSGATMRPTAPDLASLSRLAPALPHVPRPRTSLPCREGLRCLHVSCSSDPRLRAKEDSGAAACPMAPDPCLPTEEGSDAATHPTAFCGSRASSIKKGLTDLSMQLGSRIPKACSHVSKVPASG